LEGALWAAEGPIFSQQAILVAQCGTLVDALAMLTRESSNFGARLGSHVCWTGFFGKIFTGKHDFDH